VRLHYELAGGGETVTFIHGFGLDGRMWADQVPAFATRYQVLVPDLRGYGRSQIADSAHPQAADVAQLLRDLGVAKTHLVGLSMGGAVAVDLALAYPEQVASLVLVDASLQGLRWPGNAGRSGGFAELAKTVGVEAANAAFLNDAMFEGSRRRPEVFRRLQTIVTEHRGGRWLGTSPARYAYPDVIDRVHEIKAPTLIIAGELDVPYIHAAALAYAAAIAGARKVVIPTAGHMSNMDEPETFNKIVLGFLAEIAAQKSRGVT
jgi:pimeloyl-ACP methyl ester carboxylesterase